MADLAELPATGSTPGAPGLKVWRVTGEISPGGEPGQPELRASHADRDRVVELLRVAAGDGRLTADELDERLEAALTARTQRELVLLTADLPGQPGGLAPASAQRDVIRMRHKGGNARQVGQWVVPKRLELDVTGGNAVLDFTDAVVSAPALEVDAQIRGGNLVFITRPGIEVDTSDVEIIGGSVIVRRQHGPRQATFLRVDVSGRMLGGNIRVRGPRRTFWAWLLRRRTA